MFKRRDVTNSGQKKPPHHEGEDRDGVYGKEKQGLLLVATGIATKQIHIRILLHPCNVTQLLHSLLVILI